MEYRLLSEFVRDKRILDLSAVSNLPGAELLREAGNSVDIAAQPGVTYGLASRWTA